MELRSLLVRGEDGTRLLRHMRQLKVDEGKAMELKSLLVRGKYGTRLLRHMRQLEGQKQSWMIDLDEGNAGFIQQHNRSVLARSSGT